MERDNHGQLELFSSGNRPQPAGAAGENSFMGCIRSYERALLLLIGFIAVAIAAFSLGVEKGKRVSSAGSNPMTVKTLLPAGPAAPLALKPQPILKETPAWRPAAVQPPASVQPARYTQPAALSAAASPVSGYTIQLASFKSDTAAQKQAELLRKRGLNPLVMTKGSYVVLCVGNFADKQSAAPLLSELRKLYRDCLIRRL